MEGGRRGLEVKARSSWDEIETDQPLFGKFVNERFWNQNFPFLLRLNIHFAGWKTVGTRWISEYT